MQDDALTDTPPSDTALFCFGLGYSAAVLGRRLLNVGATVMGTTRNAEKAHSLTAERFSVVLDGDSTGIAEMLVRASHVLVSSGPDLDGDPTLRAHAGALSQASPRWLGYLSTTGVYGDHGGAWVDEDAPLTPATARGRARVAAETEWRAHARNTGQPLHIFRLAGIYGPGRGPFAKIRSGKARRLVKSGQVFSRIHVEDIATVLQASMRLPASDAATSPAIYNLCDDAPAPPQDVIAYAAGLLGVEPPPEQDFDDVADSMTPMARSFYAESKRVSNARIKAELGVTLAYPDYQSGLKAVLAAKNEEDEEPNKG